MGSGQSSIKPSGENKGKWGDRGNEGVNKAAASGILSPPQKGPSQKGGKPKKGKKPKTGKKK